MMCGRFAKPSFGFSGKTAVLLAGLALACSPCFAMWDWARGGKSKQTELPTLDAGTATVTEEAATGSTAEESEKTEPTASEEPSTESPTTGETDLTESLKASDARKTFRGDYVMSAEKYEGLVADVATATAERNAIVQDRDDLRATVARQKKEIDRLHFGLGLGASYVPGDDFGVDVFATMRKRDVMAVFGVEYYPVGDVADMALDDFRYHVGLVWEL